MTRQTLSILITLLLVAPLQVLLLNHIQFLGYATPMLAIYPFLRAPFSWSASRLLTMAFFFGLLLDLFIHMPGINVISLTTAVMVRSFYIRFHLREVVTIDRLTSMNLLGASRYILYALVPTLTYIMLFYAIESFNLFYPIEILLRTVLSTLLTMLFVAVIEGFNLTQSE